MFPLSTTTRCGLCVNIGTMTKKSWYLKEWREHRKLTLEALADRVTELTQDRGDRAVKLTKSDVSKLERGRRRWNQHQLEAFSEALNCEPSDLIDFTPEQAGEAKVLIRKILKRGRMSDLRMLRAMAQTDDDAGAA